ncbi:MAG: IS3 family transposase [Akkermansiaceae bacterium]
MIRELHQKSGFELSAICAALGVKRSSFYARSGAHQSDRARTDEILRTHVTSIFKEHRRRYGSRRISVELKRQNIAGCGRARTRRLMADNRLIATKTPSRYVVRTSDGAAERRAPNLMRKLSEPVSKLDQIWVADITYLPTTGEKPLYLAVVMDAFSRRVIGWKLADHLRSSLTIDALKKAIHTRNPNPGLMIHTDHKVNQFKHLTRSDRYTVEAMLRNDHSQAEIARTLQVSSLKWYRETESETC